MKILIVGSGGREHALAWKISQSAQIEQIFCAPGNPGTETIGKNVPISSDDIPALIAFAQSEQIDLTIVGPEAPLAAGIADEFINAGLKIFGPVRAAAQIESSKTFCKQLLRRWRIPTGDFETFDNSDEARRYVEARTVPVVIKADGLAAGKGVTIARTVDAANDAIERRLERHEFGDAGKRIVIEECLVGQECSVIALTDGSTIYPLAPAQDYKHPYDNDGGQPNTGGMGSYSPVPALTVDYYGLVKELILKPTIQALRCEGIEYRGALYAGLMLTKDGPKVLEFNCRFGDPETQAILPRLESDLLDLIVGATEGCLSEVRPRWSRRRCVCVVMSSAGYPGSYERGKLIHGLDEASTADDVSVFHAGTARRNGDIVTNGGRVLCVSALGENFAGAIGQAYTAIDKIHFEGAHYRRDIGARVLPSER